MIYIYILIFPDDRIFYYSFDENKTITILKNELRKRKRKK